MRNILSIEGRSRISYFRNVRRSRKRVNGRSISPLSAHGRPKQWLSRSAIGGKFSPERRMLVLKRACRFR